MNTIYERLKERWAADKIRINEGATEFDIKCFETDRAVPLPDQFRRYLLTTNGMANGETDRYLISFLSLSEIARTTQALMQTRECSETVFADYLMHSHLYVLRSTLEAEQTGVFATDGTNEKRLTLTFDEFLSNYLANPEGIANCW